MSYISRLRKKSDNTNLPVQESIYKLNNQIFIFIMILSAVVLVVDYALVIKFIDIIKNL